ncbi:MAG: sulfurtransferase FdhD [Verrucomicrobiales bacterium]|nr:sulfurtransferase FdhD [Verrucomicrobiales bacterium]
MLALLENHLSQGNRKLQSVLHEAFDAGLITRLAIGPDEEPLFQNINTQEDLEALSPSVYDRRVEIARFNREEDQLSMEGDFVAAEEPLEIRVNEKSVAVMMRTPGNDDELAAGFLVTEGMATSPDEILEIAQCPDVDPQGVGNTLEVRMSSSPDLEELTRHVFTSSSCGVCGKATIDAVFLQFPPVIEVPPISADYLLGLPGKLRAAQKTFDRTGGLHASALFDADGNLLMLREDVGRHNALDKVIGRAFLDGKDLSKCVLLVSGRISFELMQKALAARIPAVAGISAPSSLAVQLAKESGQFLAGFVRGKSFNVYSGKIEK